MVFSTFLLRYVEAKFTLLTYLMENNTVITVNNLLHKGTKQQQNKTKAYPYHSQSTKHSFANTVMRFSAKIRTRKIFMLHGTCYMVHVFHIILCISVMHIQSLFTEC